MFLATGPTGKILAGPFLQSFLKTRMHRQIINEYYTLEITGHKIFVFHDMYVTIRAIVFAVTQQH